MAKAAFEFTLGALAEKLGGTLEGPSDVVVRRPSRAGENDPEGITFAESADFLEKVNASKVGAVLLGLSEGNTPHPCIRVEKPREAFGYLLSLADHRPIQPAGIHPTAVVDPKAEIHPEAAVGPYVVIAEGAKIGARAQIFPFCYVGSGCEVGEDTVLMPHVTLVQDVRIGKHCLIQSGAVLGADGFGFFFDGARQVKVPQVGGVELGNDVEIGALTAVDRSTASDTRIGDGSKLDNLVQVAHNVVIGDHTVISGRAGIAGSVTIGNRVTVGGAVDFNNKVTVADDVTLAGRTGVDRDIEIPGIYFGSPATPIGDAMRAYILGPKLPEIMQRLRALEKKMRAEENS